MNKLKVEIIIYLSLLITISGLSNTQTISSFALSEDPGKNLLQFLIIQLKR